MYRYHYNPRAHHPAHRVSQNNWNDLHPPPVAPWHVRAPEILGMSELQRSRSFGAPVDSSRQNSSNRHIQNHQDNQVGYYRNQQTNQPDSTAGSSNPTFGRSENQSSDPHYQPNHGVPNGVTWERLPPREPTIAPSPLTEVRHQLPCTENRFKMSNFSTVMELRCSATSDISFSTPPPKVTIKTEPPTEDDQEDRILDRMRRFYPERVAEIEKMQQENVEKKKAIQEEPISPSSSPHNSQDSQDPRSSSTLPLPLKSIKMELAAEPMEDHETRLLEKMRAFCPARVEEIMRMQRENQERKDREVREVQKNSAVQEMKKLSGEILLDHSDSNKKASGSSRAHSERYDRRPRYAISPPRTQKEVERGRISFRDRRQESHRPTHRDRWDARQGSKQYSRDSRNARKRRRTSEGREE